MKQVVKCLVAVFAAMLMTVAAFAQVTTSSLNGHVADEAGEPLAGAAVIAVHTPSGTQYATIANDQGRFVINGMRTGGPYKVEISFIGMATLEYSDVYLKLGEPYQLDAAMQSSNELDAVIFVSEGSFASNKTGAGASFNLSQVESMPTIDRSVYDVVKYTPQATVNKNGGISFAGANNRYNSFQVDGAVANDSFGLSSSGTNGGQTGANPISMDAIEEIQVVVAPFDVRQSGFTGGAINSITKSGTNTVKGSAYTYYNNQDFIGTTAGPIAEGKKRTKYDTQFSETFGFTIGAPIIKNKLFIFASAEYFKKSYPNVYSPANGSYEIDSKKLNKPVTVGGKTYEFFNSELAQHMIDHYEKTYGVANSGESFAPHQKTDQSLNAMARIDWNINDNNKLMFRYQFADAFSDKYGSGSSTYYFNGSSYKQSNRTNTFVLELNSKVSDNMSNEFRATAVLVRDKRSYDYPGANMYIKDKITIDLGTEYSSGANAMNSDTYTIADNFSIFAGNHNITIGTHNEIFKFNNIFLQYAFGGYTFNTVADFFANNPIEFNYRYADPEVTGSSDPLWAATTYAAQFGLYAQDEWRPNNNFTLTYGIRADMPLLLNNPTENPVFNATDFAKNNGEYVGVVPKATILWSPRIGFRWFIDDAHKSLLRGGAGLFTGRVPFVWLSNAYNNTGMETKMVTLKNPVKDNANFPLTSNPYEDIIKAGILQASGSGATINTMNRNFKYPQVFRVNLGFDQEFGEGWKFTFDALYSKQLNNVFFSNLAIKADNVVYPVSSLSGPSAPYYTQISSDYANIVALTNTNKGYSYSFSGQIMKHFNFGLDLMASYTYGHSYSVNDGTSSVAYSNWKYNYSIDTNGTEMSYSMFDKPHKILGMISYTSPMYARMKTTVSLTYEGSSGQRFSYTMNENVDFNGDGQLGNSLLYVPTVDQISKMSWVSPADAAKFESFIRADKYLANNRGHWAERMIGLAPFEHHFDLHIAQDFYYDKKNGRKIQAVVDFMNISNMFNREWGLYYNAAYNMQILNVTAMTKDAKGNYTPTYKFQGNTVSVGDFYSRWRCQVGLRLTF